jgi:outer membrane protein TolC
MDVMGMAIYSYWKLYGAQKLYDSWNESLKADKKLLLVIEERFKNGDAAKTEVLEAKSDILYREAEVINMKTKLQEVQNDMLTLLNVPVNKNEDIRFTLLDKPDVNSSEELLTLDQYFEISLEKWPEFMITTEKIKREEIKKRYAENQTSAQLDLTAKVWLSGLDDSGKNAVRNTLKTDFTSWYVGFEYSIPLFEDHKATNQVKISRLQKQQIELEYQSLYKGLYNALSTKLAKVIDSKKQLTLYLGGSEIKDELLMYTRDKLAMGEASVRELILQEEDQINYHRKMFQTMLDWKYAQIALDKSVGTLFDKYYSYDDIKRIQPTRYDDILTNDTFGQKESKGELIAEISLSYDKESDFEKSLKAK